MQRGTRDSNAYVKARCNRMKSKLTTMFHLDSMADDT